VQLSNLTFNFQKSLKMMMPLLWIL